MNKIEVELLSLKDAAEIEALFKEVWPKATEYPEDWRKKRILSREEIMREMEGGYYYFGIRLDGRIAGLYKASIRGDSVLGEHQAVHPSYQRQGLATTMYEQLINFAKKKKCKRIHVNILANQIASKKCVDKLGFHKKGDLWEQAKGMLVQTYEKEV
jgi:RimJ/RimL family protein N-acetyltransferase